MAVIQRELVVAPEEHVQSQTTEEITELFRELGDELSGLAQRKDRFEAAPMLVSLEGEIRLEIPPFVCRILRFVVSITCRAATLSL